jgi:hypothetical protein
LGGALAETAMEAFLTSTTLVALAEIELASNGGSGNTLQ